MSAVLVYGLSGPVLCDTARLSFGGKKVYTKGVFSSENLSASTGKKEVWCIPKSLFSRDKGGKYIYTKEPLRWLLGTPSRSVGV